MSLNNKYNVLYQGEIIHKIDEDILKKRNISDESLSDIKELHIFNHLIILKMHKTSDIDTLKELSNSYYNNSKKLSILWKYNIRNFRNFYRFWELPKCRCPKYENMKLIGQRESIFYKSCDLHKEL